MNTNYLDPAEVIEATIAAFREAGLTPYATDVAMAAVDTLYANGQVTDDEIDLAAAEYASMAVSGGAVNDTGN